MKVAEIFKTMEYGPAPESRAPADAWLASKKNSFGLFIDGRWHAQKANDGLIKGGVTSDTFPSRNPADGALLATLTQAGETEVDMAVAAAKKAQPSWEALGGHGRARYLYALARLLQKHARLLSVLETLDNGKPIRETRDIDIPLVIRHFYHHAGWAQLLGRDVKGFKAVGVAGQVIPWNFPLLMLAWKVAPALAAGNTVVLKPAEYTSLTALLFADICLEAGLPKGVVNILTGDGRVGELLVKHQDVDKVAFTGSTEVGRLIRSATAGQGKKLTLELGGKSPFIVFDDADVDSAVEGLVDAIWFNQGQVCCAGSRLLVQESIAPTLERKLKARMQTLRMGDPLDKSIDVGAIIDPVQKQRIESLVNQGIQEGADVFQPDIFWPQTGCFYPPTLISNVETSSILVQEEIFGPVLVSMTFRTPDEAIALANNTRYGLAASVWSETINLALDIAPKLKAGVVWINSTNLFDAACGFGGYRESGFGREGGLEGFYDYLKAEVEENLIPVKEGKPVKENNPGKVVNGGVGDGLFVEDGAEKGPSFDGLPNIDRTSKLYIAGKQVRPDSGYSRAIFGADGKLAGHVGEGNRKDIRNAVEAARKAVSWSRTTGHLRAQILYYIAENLSARSDDFATRLSILTGATSADAQHEVAISIERLFTYGAWADKYDGAVHNPPLRGVTLAMNEPLGIIGQVCGDDTPLLSFVSCMAPAIAMGNRIIAVPSQACPLLATDFYQVLETSDVPGGVVNIVTGDRDILAKVLAEHMEVDALWYFGSLSGSEMVEKASIHNLKRTWVNYGKARDWRQAEQGEGRIFLRSATQVKNIWIPYGE